MHIPQPHAAHTEPGRIVFTRTARDAIVHACRRGRQQAVVLSWPGGATYLPREFYQPGTFDVVVRHVAGCPVYADVRRLALFRDRGVLVEAERPSPMRPHPPLRTRSYAPGSGDAARDGSGTAPHSDEPVDLPLARHVVDDLAAQFAGVHPRATVRAAVHRAIGDLRGSVNVEALPEMVTRLVRHRLDPDSAATVS